MRISPFSFRPQISDFEAFGVTRNGSVTKSDGAGESIDDLVRRLLVGGNGWIYDLGLTLSSS